MTFTLAIILGAVWRRWWGDERPAWAFPGFRATQAVTGFVTLFGICLLAGHSWWSAAIRAGLALGFLTTMAESVPHIWRGWEWIDAKVIGLRSRFRLVNGFTTYSEMTAGAAVWSIAILI